MMLVGKIRKSTPQEEATLDTPARQKVDEAAGHIEAALEGLREVVENERNKEEFGEWVRLVETYLNLQNVSTNLMVVTGKHPTLP